jgi:hypothetical protein
MEAKPVRSSPAKAGVSESDDASHQVLRSKSATTSAGR